MKQRLYITGMLAGLLLVGCQKNLTLTEWMGLDSNQGFVATNGNYFPEFVTQFFPDTLHFSSDFPTLTHASSGFKLIQVKRVSDESGNINEANLSWSKDGAFLGYEVNTNQVHKILVKDMAGNFSKQLSVSKQSRHAFLDGMLNRTIHSYNAGLQWSPDNKSYVFVSNAAMGEYNMYLGAVGDKERVFAPSKHKDGYATWHPSGDRIAFVSSRTGSGDIYVVNTDNEELEQVTHTPEVDIFPYWAPNGDFLAYSTGNSMNHDIMLAHREGHAEPWGLKHRLTRSSSDELRPTVSPDGRHVAFYVSRRSVDGMTNKWDIAVLPVTARNLTYGQIKEHIVAADVVIDINTGPTWSPNGELLLYVENNPSKFNPICGYNLYTGQKYSLKTNTRMNRDVMISSLGIISFRAQIGAWDRVFVGITNLGKQLQKSPSIGKLHYISLNNATKRDAHVY